jgi:hypothetical protein
MKTMKPMKITKNSQNLIAFLKKNNYIDYTRPTKKTLNIFHELFNDIMEAQDYLNNLKTNTANSWYSIQVKKIQSVAQITKPTGFSFRDFPESVQKHIDEMSLYELVYSFSLFERKIKLVFVLEEPDAEHKMDVYNKYVEHIFLWLYILNQYASNQCANSLVVYFYFTSLEKQLPKSPIYTLDANHVNTAFTTTCPKDSEIVVYRKEEWFKVFIHETFHNFGLDFSNMDTSECTSHILKLFPVQSQVNLFESYTEFWAEIMNACFCSFFLLNGTSTNHYHYRMLDEFLSTVEILIHFEKAYSFFQLVKTLRFMSLNYYNLYAKGIENDSLRETMYKEKTNVLSYYVIKTILLNNYGGFLGWCKSHNLSLLQFKKTTKNLKEFCLFIEKNYKTPDMLQNVQNTELFLNALQRKQNKAKKTQFQHFLETNMRMSVCEMG